jgi:hypothetical protein
MYYHLIEIRNGAIRVIKTGRIRHVLLAAVIRRGIVMAVVTDAALNQMALSGAFSLNQL